MRDRVGGISERSVRLIRRVLADFTGVERAELFGSRAKGNYRKGSDIDLAIYGEGLKPETAMDLCARLNEDTPIPYFVDVVAPKYLSDPALIDHVRRVGVGFYARPESETVS